MSVKAFDCVSVIDTLHLQGERAHTKIDCLECCGNVLYIGTSDGFIIMFSIDENLNANGKIVYSTRKLHHKCLEVRKPIKCIKAALAITRILALCDSTLFILNMSDLEALPDSAKLRGITSFCLNETPNINNSFCTQICIARTKRQLQVYNMTDEKILHERDVGLIEPAQEVAMNGQHICAALLTQYIIHDLESNCSQQLFMYDNKNFRPVIHSVAKDEFLVNACETLGMFVMAGAVSNRPPIPWTYPVHSLAYFHPYILALSDEMVTVYSILDQQQKQAIQFIGGRNIGNFDGGIFLCSGSSVYNLPPIPWENQVEFLLEDSRVDEALELAQNSNPVGLTQEQFLKTYQKFQQKAGFIYFAQSNFDKAREMFESSRIDVREVISLFPGFLPLSSTFVRAVPLLHGIADVVQLYHKDETKIKNAKSFLLNFLREVRETYSSRYSLEIDTTLLKLYSEVNAAELETFIVAGEIMCDVKDCCTWLEKNQCYHALALLYRHSKDHEKALKVWSKIISGDFKDDNFHGLPFFVECLANLKEHELVWRYAEFVLDYNEEVGVGIFTLRSNDESDSEVMKPDVIVDYLYKFPKAVILYLEHLVLEKNIQVEKFHTHLAILYLEHISDCRKNNDEEGVTKIRSKLQKLLLHSNLCRVQLLLGKMQDAGLHQEAAILYGKIEEHGKALDILVHQLKDFKSAEMYCVNTSQCKDLKYKQNLFYTLFSTYLNPELNERQREEYLIPAMDLLNSRAVDFNAAQVLEIIPSNWSVSGLESFLRGGLRASLHKYRMSKVESALARGENLQKRFALYELQRKSVTT